MGMDLATVEGRGDFEVGWREAFGRDWAGDRYGEYVEAIEQAGEEETEEGEEGEEQRVVRNVRRQVVLLHVSECGVPAGNGRDVHRGFEQ
jgi:hypothetical protein